MLKFSNADFDDAKLYCSLHAWKYDVGTKCPVCQGIKEERARVIEILHTMANSTHLENWHALHDAIDRISEEGGFTLMRAEC